MQNLKQRYFAGDDKEGVKRRVRKRFFREGEIGRIDIEYIAKAIGYFHVDKVENRGDILHQHS